MKYFISLNKDDPGGHDCAVKFEALLARFDATGDWTQTDAIALLDDITAISSIPLSNTLDAAAESVIHAGEPLPAELADATWGQPARTACTWRGSWSRVHTSIRAAHHSSLASWFTTSARRR